MRPVDSWRHYPVQSKTDESEGTMGGTREVDREEKGLLQLH
jgi:hypothetical protein